MDTRSFFGRAGQMATGEPAYTWIRRADPQIQQIISPKQLV
jgi:hypothetical protein